MRVATRCRPATESSADVPRKPFTTVLPCVFDMLDSRASMKGMIIAIDGPSGAGKGTVARAIAAALGYRHVDSGAMYRAIGWKAIRDGIPFDNEDAVAELAELSRVDVTSVQTTVD